MCKDAPAVKEDRPLLDRMAKIGLEPCKPFDMSKLDPQIQAALKNTGAMGNKQIEDNQKNMGRLDNGWSVTTGLGVYGTDYLKRATVAAFGWPANLAKDAVYSYTFTDSTGGKLSGSNKYSMTFGKDNTPPVDGFWPITMYQIDKGWWFVPNQLNKFTVSPRNNLKTNPDGSITLYIQAESPGADKESNWLPAPKNDFLLMLRMYWPKESAPSILDGSWKIPQINRVSE